MRILFVSPSESLEQGASQIAATLAEQLRNDGHEARLWAPPDPGRHLPALLHRRAQADALVAFVAGNPHFDFIDVQPALVSRALCRHNRVVARSVQPDLLYLAEEQRSATRRPLLRRLYERTYRRMAGQRVERGLLQSHCVLALGEREKQWLASTFPSIRDHLGSYVVAPPPVDRVALLGVRRQRRQVRPGAGRRFVWLGRWAEHKGTHALVLWATKHLADHASDSLTIAGAGTQTEAVAKALANIQHQVRWIPSYRRQDLAPMLADHDAGLFTSIVEGWGISLQEMLESGLPVWATDAGATNELAKYFPRQLCTFPPDRLPELELDDLSTSGYLDHFDWPHIAKQYLRSIKDLLP